MKKILCFTLLLCAGCDKQQLINPADFDYFIFGTYYGECDGNCAQLFKLEGDQLYADDSVYYFYDRNLLKFQAQSLPAGKVTFAQALKNQVPATLWNEADGRIGCPDCHDQGGNYIEIKSGNTVRYWEIDGDNPEYAAFCDSIRVTVQRLQ